MEQNPPVSLVFYLSTTGTIGKAVRVRKKSGDNIKELEKEIPDLAHWLYLQPLKKPLPLEAEVRILRETLTPNGPRIYECEVVVDSEEIAVPFNLSMETAYDLADYQDLDRNVNSIIKSLAQEVYNTAL